MTSQHFIVYRQVLREIRKASISPPATRNKLIAGNFRALFSKPRDEQQTASFLADMENTIAYMRAHREHKLLIERYNPFVDLTGEEKVKATARRVGLDVPLPLKLEPGE